MNKGLIEIRPVIADDKGDYECRASNVLGDTSKKITVSLTGILLSLSLIYVYFYAVD